MGVPLKKLAGNPKAPAKFEQGGFTSRRRKGPKTLFPGASPGNFYEVPPPRNSPRCSIASQKHGGRNGVAPAGIRSASSAKSAMLRQDHIFPASSGRSIGQLSRLSATLRNRKSRNTLMRFEARSSSGYTK